MFSRSPGLVLIFAALVGRGTAFAGEDPGLTPGGIIRLTGIRGPIEVPGVLVALKRGTSGTRIDFGQEVLQSRDVTPPGGGASLFEFDLADGTTSVVPVSGASVEGTFVSMTERAITVLRNGKEVSIPREAMAKIEKSLGRRGRWKGAGRGLLFSTGVGIALGMATGTDEHCIPCLSRKFSAVAYTALLAPFGAMMGALSGGDERWKTIDPGKMRVAVAPVAKGVGVSMSFGFSGRGNR